MWISSSLTAFVHDWGLDNDDIDNDDIAEEVNFDEYGSHFGDVSESEDEL